MNATVIPFPGTPAVPAAGPPMSATMRLLFACAAMIETKLVDDEARALLRAMHAEVHAEQVAIERKRLADERETWR